MDRIKDSGSFGPGSNPGGVTCKKKSGLWIFGENLQTDHRSINNKQKKSDLWIFGENLQTDFFVCCYILPFISNHYINSTNSKSRNRRHPV